MAEKKKSVKKRRKMSSAEKQAKQGLSRRRRNQAALSRLRMVTKKIGAAGAGAGAKGLLPQAYSEIDRAAKKGVLHKRTAARRKARLARLAK